MFGGVGISRGLGMSLCGSGYVQGGLSAKGGHQNMYIWQAGGSHRTGILSCCRSISAPRNLTARKEVWYLNDHHML